MRKGKITTKAIILMIAIAVLICGGAVGVWAYTRGDSVQKVASEDDFGYVNPDETKADPDEGFTIDGVFDEEQYQNNNWLYLHNSESGTSVDVAMTTYFGEKGMYFAYDVTESTNIYVNLNRSSTLNSCIEMYLAPGYVINATSNNLYEIDLMPTGDIHFKMSNGKGGYVNAATTDDKMAYLGATTKGGEVNTENCHGYTLELFIPWDYMEWLGADVDAMKDSFVYVDPAHIASFNHDGTDLKVDRYWYRFSQQQGVSFGKVYQFFRFDNQGAIGTVPVTLEEGANYSIAGDKTVIPGMVSPITITPEEGYALNSILVNGEEYIKKASYNEDGSVTVRVRGEEEGLKVSAAAVPESQGNITLSGIVIVNKYGGGGNLSDISISYNGPKGEKPITLDGNGKFVLTDLEPGYYNIKVEKKGYTTVNRNIYLNCDIETELTLEYEMFEAGRVWILDDQNNGLIRRFAGETNMLTKDSYNKFTFESYFHYDTELAKEYDQDYFTQQRQGFRIKFSNEKTWCIDLLYQDGEYIVQYGGGQIYRWQSPYTLTKEDAAKLTSEEGIKLGIQRDGKYVNLYLDDKLIAVEVLDEEFANCTAQLGLEGWVANRKLLNHPFRITQDTDEKIQNTYFKRTSGWDVTGQYEGVITLPEGGRGNIKMADKMGNMDFTLRVQDNQGSTDKEGTYPRTDVLFVFDNGAHISFGITADAEHAWVQSMNNSANTVDGKETPYIYKRWTNWGDLTAEEFEQFKNGGVDFRIVRYGTEVTLYIGDRMVAVADLTNNDRGVTADMPAAVTIRHYDDAGVQIDFPFSVKETFDFVTITSIPDANGRKVATEKQQYFVGDTVKLLADREDYYVTSMKVNGKEVTLEKDGTYSFKATEKSYTVEGTLAKRVFAESKEWNLQKQNEGIIIIPMSDGDSDWVKTVANTYKDVELTFTLIDQKSEDTNFRTAVRFYFTNGETVTFTVTNDTKDGSYVLQNMNGTILSWFHTGYTLSAEQTAKITSSEGLKMRIIRIGSGVDIYFGEEHAYGFDLSENADGKDSGVEALAAQIGVRQYGNTGVDAVIPFAFADAEEPIKITIKDSENGTAVTKQMHYYAGQTVIASGKGEDGYYCTGLEVDGEEVILNGDGTYSFEAKKEGHTLKGSFAPSVFKNNSAWDLLGQNKNYKNEDGVITADGVVALPNGGNGGWLEFYDKYTDMDLTLKVRDDQASEDQGTKWPRTDVLFLFDVDGDGKYDGEKDVNVSFGVITNAGGAWIQSLNNGADAKNPNRIYDIFTAHGDLTPEEYEQFKKDGVEFRIVRKGTDIHLYIGDRKVNVRDIAQFHQSSTYEGAVNTTGATGITADTQATVFIRHYDDAGVDNLEIPYSVTEVMPEKAIIDIADDIENGTITTMLDSSKYFIGDKVALITTGESDYYYDSLKANGEDVRVDENALLPTFTAKAENEVTGSFAPEVFTNIREWNAVNQNVGILAVAKSDGDTDWIDTKDFAYRGITLTVKDESTNTNDFGVAIHLAFDNGESFRFRLDNTDKNTGYRIQTMNGDTMVPNWNSPYTLDDDEVAKITGEGIEFRVTIVGEMLYVYLGDKTEAACSFDLSKNADGNDSGVGSRAAKVSVRFYGNTGCNTLIPYDLEEAKPVDITFTNEPSDEGGSVEIVRKNKESGQYEVVTGDSYVNGMVTLRPTAKAGYLYTGLKVNGEDVTLDADGTYTFTATESVYSVTGSFEASIFQKTNAEWDVSKQYEGIVSIPNMDGDTGWLHTTTDTYRDWAVTVRDHKTSTVFKMEVIFTFPSGDQYKIRLDNEYGTNTEYRIQNVKGSINNNWNAVHILDDSETAKLHSEEGIEFRVAFVGTYAKVYLDDVEVSSLDISSKVTTETASISMRMYGNSGVQNIEIPFSLGGEPEAAVVNIADDIANGTITTDVGSYIVGQKVILTVAGESGYYYDSLTVNGESVMVDNNGNYSFIAKAENTVTGSFAEAVLTTSGKWNLLHHNVGILALTVPSGNKDYSGWADTKDYAYRGITLTVKDESTNTYDFGVAIHLAFDNGESFRFRLDNTDKNTGYRIQTMNGDTLVTNWYSPYTLDDDEVAKITGEEGIEFRVTIVGETLYVYLDGKTEAACSFDLSKNASGNDSGVGNRAAKVSVRFYGNAGYDIVLPYDLEEAQPAVVTVDSNIANGTFTTDESSYIVGGKVTLTVAGESGYYYDSLTVNGESVIADESGNYSFIAKAENEVTGSFAPEVFTSMNDWNVINQNVGILSVTQSDGDTGWLSTKDFAYRGITLTVKNESTNTNDFGVAIHLAFDNGESFRFRLSNTDGDGKYKIQTMDGDTMVANWNRVYTLDDAETEKITGEEGLKFRVTLVEETVYVYLGEKTEPVCSFDLSKNASGADSGVGSRDAQIFIRFYGNTGYDIVLPCDLEEPQDNGLTTVLTSFFSFISLLGMGFFKLKFF